jgi:hypothetical protein
MYVFVCVCVCVDAVGFAMVAVFRESSPSTPLPRVRSWGRRSRSWPRALWPPPQWRSRSECVTAAAAAAATTTTATTTTTTTAATASTTNNNTPIPFAPDVTLLVVGRMRPTERTGAGRLPRRPRTCTYKTLNICPQLFFFARRTPGPVATAVDDVMHKSLCIGRVPSPFESSRAILESSGSRSISWITQKLCMMELVEIDNVDKRVS